MINTITATHRLARPYSRLAASYDAALGISNFIGTRTAFETLVNHYGIAFRSAADIGCGTGLFACYLRQCWGVPVFAVDRSSEMLAVAANNCPNPNVCFLQQDIRCLRLPCPVDLITANFDTMNHLLTGLDLKRSFRRIRENLRPGGHFIFDLITPCQPLRVGQTHIRRLGPASCPSVQRIRWNPWQRMLLISVILRSLSSTVPKVEVHRERAYSPVEVGRWLMDAGFVIRGMHDAVTLRMAAGCPPRIIVIARRKTGRRQRDIRCSRANDHVIQPD
jgi:SAM-dependent methyltransferase